MELFKLIHILAVVIWVGGMFFSYMVLRPGAAEVLQPPERLRLWAKVFARVFNWVWLAVFLLLISGFYMIHLLGGIAHVPRYIHLLLLFGIATLCERSEKFSYEPSAKLVSAHPLLLNNTL